MFQHRYTFLGIPLFNRNSCKTINYAEGGSGSLGFGKKSK